MSPAERLQRSQVEPHVPGRACFGSWVMVLGKRVAHGGSQAIQKHTAKMWLWQDVDGDKKTTTPGSTGFPLEISIGMFPFPVIVTTRIISCLVGDSYKPSFATITGKGDNPRYLRIFFRSNRHKRVTSILDMLVPEAIFHGGRFVAKNPGGSPLFPLWLVPLKIGNKIHCHVATL